MKKLLTDNIGLKILALLAATILWVVVVNVDDPVVEKRFSGIPVEVVNDEAISKQNKTYEILDGSDTVTVIVKGKRSILDQMSKDYIKATADIKNLTIMDTVPIEVRSTRLSDRLESIVSTTKNLKVHIEELGRKQVEITVATTGSVNAGNALGSVKPDVNILTVSGPVSLVRNIVSAKAEIDVTGLSKDVSTTAAVHLYDANGDPVSDSRIKSTVTSVHVDAQILETKEVEVSAITSGNPAEGYALTGVVTCNPSRITVAGRGSSFQELSRLVIPESLISVTGAMEDITQIVNVSSILPDGVRFAEEKLWYEDLEFTAIAIHRAKKIAHLDESLYHYRRGLPSTMNNRNAEKNLDLLTVMQHLEDELLPDAKDDFVFLVLNHVLLDAMNRVQAMDVPEKRNVLWMLRSWVHEKIPRLSSCESFRRESRNRRIIMRLHYLGLSSLAALLLKMR